MDDTFIIELYWNRDEQAIQETDRKYGRLCFSLANNILKRDADSEECVNDTLLKVWNSIPDDRPEHFSAYLCQIVKRIALSKYRYNKADKRQNDTFIPYDELFEIVSGGDNPEDAAILNELSESINTFLLNESVQNRQMFIRRYWYYDSVEVIAQTFRINPQTVGSILFRIRKRLKKYLQKEGYDL